MKVVKIFILVILLLIIGCGNKDESYKYETLIINFKPALFQKSDIQLYLDSNIIMFQYYNVYPNETTSPPIKIKIDESKVKDIMNILNSFEEDDFLNQANKNLLDGMDVDIFLYHKNDDVHLKQISLKNTSTPNQIRLYRKLFEIIKKEELDSLNQKYIERINF